MDKPNCSEAGCETSAFATGLCRKHYMKARAERLKSEPCRIEGCERPRDRSDGLCQAHYLREREYGDPLAGPPMRKVRVAGNAPSGVSSEYHENHRAVRKARGPAWKHRCEHCAGQAQTWAMRHESDGSKPDDYMPLCWPCHAKYDDFAARLPDNTGSKRTAEQRARMRDAALRREARNRKEPVAEPEVLSRPAT